MIPLTKGLFALFFKVKQQLKQATDDIPLQPPPAPPGFGGPPGFSGPPGPFGMHNAPDPHGPMGHPGPGAFGPRMPQGFNQGPFRPGMNRPGPPGPGPFGPNMGPRGAPPSNNFMPPGFMGPHGRGGGGNNFPPGSLAPPPPPGFIPSQVNRTAMNNSK